MAGRAVWDRLRMVGRQLVVKNDGDADWTGCSLRFPDGRASAPGLGVRAHGAIEIRAHDLKNEAGESSKDKPESVTVRCDQGTATFPVR